MARLPARLVGTVVGLTPTSVGRWTRCRRHYLLKDLLDLPPVDLEASNDEGLFVHALLKQLHETGDCRDLAHRRAVAEAYAPVEPERLLSFFDRHARRCPDGANALGHEYELARYQGPPGPPFVLGGRIDVVWVHDGILDARDYKTGAPRLERVGDDPAARAYAWLLAPEAARRGLRLRLRYEILADGVTDDPEEYEPDDDEIAGIGDWLSSLVDDLRGEHEFRGVAVAAHCDWCAYRSICSDAVVTPNRPNP